MDPFLIYALFINFFDQLGDCIKIVMLFYLEDQFMKLL